MPRDNGLLDAVAGEVDLPREKVSDVLDSFSEGLHRRMYEYEGFNGDYISETLIWELSDKAWFHLFQFLALYHASCFADHPGEVIMESGIQLGYLGGPDRWQLYFDEMREWRMSRRLQDRLNESAT